MDFNNEKTNERTNERNWGKTTIFLHAHWIEHYDSILPWSVCGFSFAFIVSDVYVQNDCVVIAAAAVWLLSLFDGKILIIFAM